MKVMVHEQSALMVVLLNVQWVLSLKVGLSQFYERYCSVEGMISAIKGLYSEIRKC